MKKDIHPENYRYVVFQDVSCDYKFLTRSTIETKDTIKWEDGNEYPLYKLDISSKSHPYFTGQQNLVDTSGRVEKYMNNCVKDMKKHGKEAFDEKKSVLACQQYYQTYPQMFVYWKGRIVTMDN